MFAPTAWIDPFLTAASCLLASVALYTDARWRTIPNWLVVGLAGFWALAAWLAPGTLVVAKWPALACGLGGLVAGYAFYVFGWLGGGDGKLLGVLALWLGPKDLGLWLMATACIGVILVLFARLRRHGDLQRRGIPFAWAMVPPAVTLLIARAAA